VFTSIRQTYDNSFAHQAFAFPLCQRTNPTVLNIAFVRQVKAGCRNALQAASKSELQRFVPLANATIDCFNLLNITTAGYMVGKSLLKSAVNAHGLHSPGGCAASSEPAAPCIRMLGYSVELEILAELERNTWPSSARPGRAASWRSLSSGTSSKSKEQEMLLDEYLEKVILYGFMTMFGSAFYWRLAVALIAMAIDWTRSGCCFCTAGPVPLPARASASELVARLSQLRRAFSPPGRSCALQRRKSLSIYGVATTDSNRLIFLFIVENAMLAIKFLLVISIGDMPRKLKLCLKWEYFYVKKILTDDKVEPGRCRDKNRWYHALCPCCATITTPNPEAGPQLV
uniref:DUF4220 domain-containing protein n=1 Tax=Macrostomum lignano TaxID=282301 RepID=A0A1I8FQB7_9PLAT